MNMLDVVGAEPLECRKDENGGTGVRECYKHLTDSIRLLPRGVSMPQGET